ncbi:MAG: endonuclease VII domain-containing protein [Candidatus Altimarinota bacterium]
MLWADYRLTPEDYQFLLEKQNGVCAICLQPSSDDRSLAVDHCHTTGKVRGLLCMRHNLLLGFAQDDPQILTAAIQYLKSHSGRLAGFLRGVFLFYNEVIGEGEKSAYKSS